MQHLSKTSWAYLAGILDGEGSISISRSFAYRVAHNKKYYCYGLKVIISNTDTKLIKWLQRNIGGLVCVSSKPKKRETTLVRQRKICYRWTPSTHELSKKFLLAILPYMRMKRRQAILALQFIDLNSLGKKDCPAQRSILWKRCTALNSGKPRRD
jgi:hypothetical protein